MIPPSISGPTYSGPEPEPTEQSHIHLPELAFELVDEILSYIRNDRTTLWSCALAIRSWLPSIRRILFRSMSVMPKGPKGFLPFIHFLASTPQSSISIKSLKINGCFLFDNNHFCSHLLSRMLLTLPALESLHIHCAYFNHPPPISVAQSWLVHGANPSHSVSTVSVTRNCKFHLPSPRPSKIRRLRINVTEIGDENIQDLLDIFYLFAEIDCLELYRDWRYAHIWTTSLKLKYPSVLIHELKCSGSSPPTLGFLQASITAHALNAIELTLEEMSDISRLGALLFEVGPDIHSLTLFPRKVIGPHTDRE